MTPAPLDYSFGGLPGVWLLDGFRRLESRHGPALTIRDPDGLHAALARILVTRGAPLRGIELRFLRRLMALGQASLAALLGASEQTLARWEKGQSALSPAAERLMRLIVTEYLGDEVAVRTTLALRDDTRPAVLRLRLTRRGWRQAA